MSVRGYETEIDAVKRAMIEQKVPVKYYKGLATLCVLNCAYEGGDPLAGVILEKAMAQDPELIIEFEYQAGITQKSSGRFRIGAIRDAFAKDYQIFRALKQAGITMDLFDCMRDVK